ncbi:MAG: DUF1549 domain-containing protein [Planctomycetes bacterium]|nr:DUF1549 domain-containing protein [Planctomycetota bacterium]
MRTTKSMQDIKGTRHFVWCVSCLVLSVWGEALAGSPSAIAPRRLQLPAAPPGRELANPIDLLLQDYYAQHNVRPAQAVDDRTYARRVYQDVIGLPPTPAQLTAFAEDKSADKRAALVDKLLSDRHNYAVHWMTFWNDLLRNDYRGTGYIDGGRQQITGWLYGALADNMPFDRFVGELCDPTPESAGFVKGIVWRGVVNASQTPEVQAAQNIAQVFMGINLKCASCHDSFINQWKLADAYALAGVFAEKPLEMHRCDSPIGEFAPLKFLYPELGKIDAHVPKAERLKALAAIITSPDNGRLTRTIVNRLWARFLGRGLIEPVDDMDLPAWTQDVLDYLAADLSDHGYDLQRTMRLILTSRTYQLPSVGADEQTDEEFIFRGPVVRRLSAEQFVDAVAALTGGWHTAMPKQIDKGLQQQIRSAAGGRTVRAALVTADPLMVALGRPNREQVVTVRPAHATTLAALELTNGQTLAEQLTRGAQHWLRKSPASTRDLVERLYFQALGRSPTAEESQVAEVLVGSPATVEGVEDLLWAVVVLPEFQLIE